MINASKAGQNAMVRLLLERGAQLETAESGTGRTPVLFATGQGHEATALVLVEKGARVDLVDKTTGRNLLSWSAGHGMETLVRRLLDRGVEVNTTDVEGRTPGWWAAAGGHTAVLQLLLEKGAEPDAMGGGQTPLCVAASQGHAAVVRMLADAGARIDGKLAEDDELNPLLLAVGKSDVAVIRELVGRGASPGHRSALHESAASNGDYESALALLEAGDDVAPPPEALYAAVANNYVQIVQLLLSKGVVVPSTTASDAGTVSLLYAAEVAMRTWFARCWRPECAAISRQRYTAMKMDQPAIARCLLTVWERADWAPLKGRTLLGWAAKKGYEGIVRSLLELGADPNIEEAGTEEADSDGGEADTDGGEEARQCRTALWYAAKGGYVRIVDQLLDKMKKPRDSLQVVEMLLHGAGNEGIAAMLVDAAPECMWDAVRDGDGAQVLVAASRQGHQRAVKLLLDSGIDPNATSDGRIPSTQRP